MATAALWTNIMAFAFLSSSLALSVIIRFRKRQEWFDWYIIYTGCYALWSVIFALHFFFVRFGANPPGIYTIFTACIRAFLSGGIIFALPMMVRGFKQSVRQKRTLLLLGIIGGLVFTALGLLARIITHQVYISRQDMTIVWQALPAPMESRKHLRRKKKSQVMNNETTAAQGRLP